MSKRTTLLAGQSIALVILTLCASVAQAQTILPEWASRGSRAWNGQPQLPDRVERFRRATAPVGRLSDALLLCRVHVDGRWDMLADPDLRVRARLGRRSADWWGSENSRTEVFSVAGVSLRPGDRLQFRIVDRDVTFDDRIGTVSGRYGGGEVDLQEGQAQVECRQVDEEDVTAGRQRALAREGYELTRLESAAPDLAMDNLGRPVASHGPLVEAATWSGWSHPEVSAARRAHVQAEAQFDRALSRSVRDAHRASPRPGRPLSTVGGTVRVESVECGPQAQARMLPEERTANRCAAVIVVSEDAHLGRVDVLTPAGVFAQPPVRYLDGEDKGQVVLTLPQRPPATALLRFGSARQLLRLR